MSSHALRGHLAASLLYRLNKQKNALFWYCIHLRGCNLKILMTFGLHFKKHVGKFV